MPKLDTNLFGHKQSACEDQQAYEDLILDHMALFENWKDHMKPLLESLSTEDIMAGCGVGVNTARSFRNEIPAKRKNVIMLCAMLHLNMRQTNEVLMRWAKYNRLYPKHAADFIWCYLIRNGGSDRPKEEFDRYWAVYKRLLKEESGSGSRLDTHLLAEELQQARRQPGVKPERDLVFQEMMRKAIPAFRSGYEKLIQYIEGQFVRLCDGQAGRLTPEEKDLLRDTLRVTPNVLFQDNAHYLTTYYNRMRRLKNEHLVPERTFLISLGIRLAMSSDQINELLELAGMAPLCPKDKLESAITFYLEELFMEYPSFFRDNPLNSEAACTLRDARPAGMNGGNTPLLRFDAQGEAPTEKMTTYIKRRLEETNIFTDVDRKALDEFLGLISGDEA